MTFQHPHMGACARPRKPVFGGPGVRKAAMLLFPYHAELEFLDDAAIERGRRASLIGLRSNPNRKIYFRRAFAGEYAAPLPPDHAASHDDGASRVLADADEELAGIVVVTGCRDPQDYPSWYLRQRVFVLRRKMVEAFLGKDCGDVVTGAISELIERGQQTQRQENFHVVKGVARMTYFRFWDKQIVPAPQAKGAADAP